MKKEDKKINPKIMEQTKIKNIKINKSLDDDDDESTIKKLIIITVIIVVIIGIVYAATELIKKDNDSNLVNENAIAEINYSKVTVGTMLNRPYNKYYVLIYNANDEKAVLYSTIMTKYMEKENSKKIYFCDLNSKLNADYYNINDNNKSNPNAKNVEDFNFGDLTLIKIENGKIVQYVEDLETIREILK